jgi:hypothetical protein
LSRASDENLSSRRDLGIRLQFDKPFRNSQEGMKNEN